MVTTIAEAYSELWHYTTVQGLKGIIETQEIWSTHYRYLNDGEELSGFFARKFPKIVGESVKKALAVAMETQPGRDVIEKEGGLSALEKRITEGLTDAYKEATLDQAIFLTSFCKTREGAPSRDGLLSQWRGYGADGGYAIVFDATALSEMFSMETSRSNFSFCQLSDVNYHEDGADPEHPETSEYEESLRKAIQQTVLDRSTVENLYSIMLTHATRHKHCGFREEQEIRLALALGDKHSDSDPSDGEKNDKQVGFIPRGGLLVPYVSLFAANEKSVLPIKRIVVGPHSDKHKRKHSIEMFLEHHRLRIPVDVSDTPYIGR